MSNEVGMAYLDIGKGLGACFWGYYCRNILSLCYHCKQLTPTWDSLAENNENLNIGRVNCDESPAICQQFGVRMYPSILAIRNSEVAEKNSGIRNYYFLTFWMYRCIYLTALQWYLLLAGAVLSVFGYLIYLIVCDPLPESIDSKKIK